MIRRCTIADKEKWCEFNLAFMKYEYDEQNVWENPIKAGELSETFEKIINDNNSPNLLFFIQEGSEIIGFINAAYFFSIWAHGKALFIDDFFIIEEFRSKGYGRKALQDLEIEMKRKRFKRFQLLAEDTNPRAIQFYERENYSRQRLNFFCKYFVK